MQDGVFDKQPKMLLIILYSLLQLVFSLWINIHYFLCYTKNMHYVRAGLFAPPERNVRMGQGGRSPRRCRTAKSGPAITGPGKIAGIPQRHGRPKISLAKHRVHPLYWYYVKLWPCALE
ncbi:hypothetical protein [uncultured Gemmiger sp.]|uniref:hypothetical protein n=1 Tax=uncultured Gemmiger sp. TaxID=1623490 RepID=UPI0025DAB1AD|nr:hypothetical protein [uncultured Gemmiger sp.]